MHHLLDTGVLLRRVNRQAEDHNQIRQAVRVLKSRGDVTVTTFQNVSEFWNVCTRPTEARGGLGLSLDDARRRLRTIERVAAILPYPIDGYSRWKQLVFALGVKGVQVHDAKLVAMMGAYNISHLVTLNPADFRRYPGIVVQTPDQLVHSNAG